MAKENKYYMVDSYADGTWRMMGEKTLRHLYDTEINHDVADCGYPDFEGWLADMKRHDLITEVR